MCNVCSVLFNFVIFFVAIFSFIPIQIPSLTCFLCRKLILFCTKRIFILTTYPFVHKEMVLCCCKEEAELRSCIGHWFQIANCNWDRECDCAKNAFMINVIKSPWISEMVNSFLQVATNLSLIFSNCSLKKKNCSKGVVVCDTKLI